MSSEKLIGFVYNGQRPEYMDFVDHLVSSLSLDGRMWSSAAEDLPAMDGHLEETGLIVTVGGDGTILRTVRYVSPHAVPILGVNKGRVGFMTEVTDEEAVARIPAYLEGDYWVEERTMLQAAVFPQGADEPTHTLHALNDHVLGRAAVARLVDVNLRVDDVLLTTYRADAVIASTSTGSTAYAMSAGGPILHPQAKVFLVQPVAPHMGMRMDLCCRMSR